MLKTRGRKIMGDVFSRKMRTALVATSIFIGVLGVVTIVGAGNIMLQAILDNMQEDEIAMQQLFVVNPTGETIEDPAGQLDELLLELQSDGVEVESLEGRATYEVQWIQPGNDKLSIGNIRAYSKPFADIEVAPMQLLEGDFPELNNREVAVEIRLAEKYDVEVGDELQLAIASLPTDANGDLIVENWTVTGLLMHAYDDYTGGNLVPQSEAFYVNYADAQYIANVNGYNALLLRYSDYDTAKAQSDMTIAGVREHTTYVDVFNFMEDPAENITLKFSRQYISVFNMLGVIAMLVSGFLVFNVINTIVIEQKKQIGIMKSMGAGTPEIFSIYAGIALLYGLLGMIPGVLLGIPAAYYLAESIGPLANVYIADFTVSMPAVILGLVMGILVPAAASIIPVLLGTRVSILNAITDLGISGNYGSSAMARRIGQLPLPVSVRQAFSNIWQKGLRLTLTAATLTAAVGAFMGVTAVFGSVGGVLDDAFNTLNYEVAIAPEGKYTVEDIELALADVDEVEHVFPGLSTAIKIPGYSDPQLGLDQISVIGINPDDGVAEINLLEGAGFTSDNPEQSGIILTYSVANVLDVEVGDNLEFVVGGQPYELEILGISSFPFDLGYMRWQELARIAGFTENSAPPANEYLTMLDSEGVTLPALGISADFADEMPIEPVAGTFPTSEHSGVVISQDLATERNLSVGDSLALTGTNSEANYEIVGIIEVPASIIEALLEQNSPATDQPVAFAQESLRYVLLPYSDLVSLDWDVTDAGNPLPNAFFVQLNINDATPAQVEATMSDMRDALQVAGIANPSLTNQVQIEEESAQQMLVIGGVFNIAAVVMALVGALGLLTTLSMAVFERQKEIGVMRSIGAGSSSIVTQFLIEGLMVSVLAWLVGVPLSYLLSLGLMAGLPFGDFVKFTYPLYILPMGLIGIVTVAFFASLWPSLAAARRTVSDILRYQ